jgi:hypothetical protein
LKFRNGGTRRRDDPQGHKFFTEANRDNKGPDELLKISVFFVTICSNPVFAGPKTLR